VGAFVVCKARDLRRAIRGAEDGRMRIRPFDTAERTEA
jgi:hypothetical protein